MKFFWRRSIWKEISANLTLVHFMVHRQFKWIFLQGSSWSSISSLWKSYRPSVTEFQSFGLNCISRTRNFKKVQDLLSHFQPSESSVNIESYLNIGCRNYEYLESPQGVTVCQDKQWIKSVRNSRKYMRSSYFMRNWILQLTSTSHNMLGKVDLILTASLFFISLA